MGTKIGVGLLGLGTVGAGVAGILQAPEGRHPLVAELELVRIAVRNLRRPRSIELPASLLTNNPQAVVDDPSVQVVVEVMGGIEPARTLIMRAIAAGKAAIQVCKLKARIVRAYSRGLLSERLVDTTTIGAKEDAMRGAAP